MPDIDMMEQSTVVNPAAPDPGRGAALNNSINSEPATADSELSKRRPRCYVCSFCSREFRNAQALGGHMNVHRRERVLANQLLELRNQGVNGNSAKVAGSRGVAHASNNPPVKGDEEPPQTQQIILQDVMTHVAACDMHGEVICAAAAAGSSSSSSSPPSPQASGTSFASSLVQPRRDPYWRSLQQLPCQKPSRLARRDSSVDLELRLGLTEEKG